MSSVERRVIKLGGSLLAFPDLIRRLRTWLAAQPAAENLLVVGGGRLADAVRELDRLHHVGESESHWLCVRAMALNGLAMLALLPESQAAEPLAELLRYPPRSRLLIVDPWQFLHDEEPRLVADPLPQSWDVTSDSIAARLASVVAADELVLLKSALPKEPHTQENIAAAGFVDPWFARTARDLRNVRCVNLRDAEMPETCIAPRPA